jgi:predicted Holliday junction resolvase-like endonuclease
MVTFFIVAAVVGLLAALIAIGVAVSHLSFEAGQSESQEEIGRLKAESEQSEESRAALIELNTRTTTRVLDLEAQLKKTVSQKKSSEVRTGLIVEQMAPFLEGFPYDPRSAIFLGKPLDFLVFDEEGVHFVEVKSGKAQLSTSQRRIRDQLKDKKVTFEVYRIKGE